MITRTARCLRFCVFFAALAATALSPVFAFVHPGGLHTQADLDRMKAQVAAGAHPWIDSWGLLIQDPLAQPTYAPKPLANMGTSRQAADLDAHAAYLNAIRWYISGDTRNADCAVAILNAWTQAVNQVPTGNDTPGLIAIPIQNFALAAEVLRLYPGWSQADQDAFKTTCATYLYPMVNDFLTRHNGQGPTHYWANWDACNIGALLAMGVFCDNQSWFDQGVTYYQSGIGAGAIANAVVAQFPGNLYNETIGQWQESGRDQSHSQLGLGLLGYACQTAWNQGVDLFGYAANRFLTGAEYVAQYNLWHDVPYTQYTNSDPTICAYVARNLRGQYGDRPVYELLYNHYVVQQGLYAPNVKAMAELQRPEAGSNDHFGYGTLTFTQVAWASPYPVLPVPPAPTGLTATATVGGVWLSWMPPAGDVAAGYNVLRATKSGGPYTTIYSSVSGTKNDAALYTDTAVANGTAYYYVVQAVNQSGTSPSSAEVSALPVNSMALAAGWADRDIGTVMTPGSGTCSPVSGNTFVVAGAGSDISGAADSFHYVYQAVSGDFTFVGRLGRETLSDSDADKIGLMMRESLDPGARNVALILYSSSGGKQQVQYRANANGSTSSVIAQNYVYAPQWFKLVRSGNTFTGSISLDGSNWLTTATVNVTMATSYFAGIAVCSRSSTGAVTSGILDNVTSVDPLPNPPVITSATSATGTVGTAFSYQIAATANPTSYDATGLPSGLGVDPSTGLISGTPTVAGTYNATIAATNTSGTTTATLTITVNPAVATNGTWNSTGVGPLTLNLTFTAGSSTIAYTVASTTPAPSSNVPVVGDAIRINTTVGNFPNGNAFFVVAVNSAAGTLQLGSTRGGAAQTASASGTSLAPIYLRWSNAVNWTSGTIANGYGAVATIPALPSNVRIALGGNWIVGAIAFAGGGGSDLDLSGYDYATAAGGSITFATGTTTVPLFSVGRNTTFPVNMPGVSGATGTRLVRVIGNQGLEVMSSSDSTVSGSASWRPNAGLDWSGFSGDFQLRQGRIDVIANNVLPSASNLVLGNGNTAAGRFAVLSMFIGRSQMIGALSGSAIARVSAGTSSTSTAGTPVTLTLGGNNGSGTFAGIAGADAAGSSANTTTLSIVKNGTGVEVFSGANVYTGTTTVNAGTFLLNGSLVGPVVVNAGTFGGAGSTSNTVTIGTGVGSGATFAPGNAGLGTFTTTGALTLRSDAMVAFEISPSTVSADKIVANGVTLNNPIFSPQVVGTNAAVSGGTVLTLIVNTSGAPVSGTFNGLPEGSTVTVGVNACRLSYVGGDGNDVTLTVLGAAQPPVITSTSAGGAFGAGFSFAVVASNTPTSFSATGLPAGLTINATTGVISGTPLAAGTFTATIVATNGAGSTTAPLTIAISSIVGVNLRAYNTYGLASSDAAGVVRATNWNNLVGPATTGETVSSQVLVDNLGLPVAGTTVSFTAGTTGGSYTNSGTLKFGTDAVTVGPAANDANLYSSAFDQYDGTPSVLAVSDIPYASYDAIFYIYDGGVTQGGTITVNGQTLAIRGGVGNPDANGNGYVASNDAVNTGGPTVQQGNYVRFNGLTGDLTATLVATNVGSTTTRLKLAGFQIISRDAIAAPTTAPSAPASVTAAGGNTQVALGWSYSPTATAYKIYRDGAPLATVASPLMSYADTAVTNGIAYSYAVSAVSSAGEGPQSAVVTATPAAPGFSAPQRTVYQYSVPMAPTFGSWAYDPQRRAYLWVPPGCTKIQGVVIGLHNMLEKPLFDDPAIRQACADANLAIVFISPGDSKTWTPNGVGNYIAGKLTTAIDLDPNNYVSADINPATGTNYSTDINPATGARFPSQTEQAGAEVAALLTKLAAESGYAELQYAPVMFAGHSAASPFVWTRGVYATSAMSGRVFALLPYKGTFPGSLPAGMPVFHTASEWQEISNWGNTWELGDAPSLRNLRAGGSDRLLSSFVQPGTGHYDYAETQSAPIALFIKKAAQYRIPANWVPTGYPTLTTVAATSGYLVDVTKVGTGNCQPVAYADWVAAGRDPLRAYWYFDAEIAHAVCDAQNAGFSKRPQMINAFQNATTLAPLASQNNGTGYVSLTATLLSDGMTFKVQGASMNQSPVSRLFNGSPLGIPTGSITFKANGSGALKQVGVDTFRVWMDRGTVIKEGQPWEPFIIARHAGDANYREADRPIWVSTSAPVNNITGAAQTVTFGSVPDQDATNLQPIVLTATASSGLPVQYWVVSGPYRNDENDSSTLVPDGLPDRATYPIRVVVGAWQWGKPGVTAAATPVYQEFWIRMPAPTITSASSATGTYATPLSFAVAATHSPTGYAATGLPPGLAIDPQTGLISGSPAATGDFTVTVSATNQGGTATGTLLISIAKAEASIQLGNLATVYDGAPHSATVSTLPAGLSIGITYDGRSTPPTNAGSYVVTATVDDPNYAGSTTATGVIAKAAPAIAIVPYDVVYDSTAHSATGRATGVQGEPLAGLDLATTTHTAAGRYVDGWTFTDVTGNYLDQAGTATDVIAQADPRIAITPYRVTYDGAAHTAIGSAIGAVGETLAGLNLNGTTHTDAGTYADTWTFIDVTGNYRNAAGSVSDAIGKAAATVALSPLFQSYDGEPKAVTATTTPSGLSVNITYDGESAAPIYPGGHMVVATIDDPNYSGSQTSTLTIGIAALVRHAPTLNGFLDGSLQQLLPEDVTLGRSASVSGDLLVPGLPVVDISAQANYGSTVDATGAPTPASYSVAIGAGSVLRHVVRRVDALVLPPVAPPPAPDGTRDVTVNNSTSSIGDPATLRNLTLTGGASSVTLPPGTFGSIVVGSGTTLVLGDAHASDPTVYNLQSLTLNSNATLQVAGPVIVNLAKGPTLNGRAGAEGHSEWLALFVSGGDTVADDDATLNGNVVLHGSIVDPTGTITVNGNATIYGRVAADRLTINGNGLIKESP